MAYLDEHERKAEEILARARTERPKASHWERFKWCYLGLLGLLLIRFFYMLAR